MPWFFIVRGATEPCAPENFSFRSHKSLGESPVTHSRGQGQLVSDRGRGAVAISVWRLMGGDNLGGLRTKNVRVPLPLTVRPPGDHFLGTDARSGKLPAHVP